jgi:hypothetical protein
VTLIPPPWLREVVRLTAPKVHAQIQVVLEAYATAPDYACPFTEPTLECGDCATRVMLQESRTRKLRAEWWEVTGAWHTKGHSSCRVVYQPHSRLRCREAMILSGRSPLPWIFDGIS